MGPMSVVDHNDMNYKIKLAVACQLENMADEKVAEALVEAPRKDALGKYTKVPKENKEKGKKDQKSIETQMSGSCVLATEECPRNLVDHKAGGHAHASTESYVHVEPVIRQLTNNR
jgi:hypothetical protein